MEPNGRYAYEMLVMDTLRDENEPGIELPYIDAQVRTLGDEVVQLWQAIKSAVHQQAK